MATSFFGARPLYSWWQRQQRLPRQAITLGVTGLPEGAGRLPQGAPALLLTQDEASTQCWTPLLLQALLAGGPVLVLAACAKDADALWQYPALRQAYDAGRLRVALFPPEKQQCLRHDGLQHWASEVRRASRGRASVCVLDARALFAGATQAELRRLGGQLRRFASQQVWPVALMLPLARATDGTWFMEGTQIAAAARSASLGMGHVATLALEAAQPVLSLHSWDGGEQGALFHMRYDLHQQDGALVYAGSCAHGEVPVLVQAPDAEVVYTTSACVPAPVIVPDNWVVLPDLPALEQAAQQAVGATLVLDVGDPPRFDELCALVHRLRSKRPASLKIIVRETTAKLRAHSEQALLHLGVTAVAYRELGFARLLRLIASCRTLVHTQQPQEDLAQALAAFVPATVRGYQSPRTFERIAREMLERGSSVGLTHALVHLQLLPQIAHLDALKACRALRDGDVVTADAHGILVFLFACTAADVPQALSNMFTVPIEQLFAAQAVDSSTLGITAMLQQLHQQAGKLPDYTPALLPQANAEVQDKPRQPNQPGSVPAAPPKVVLPSAPAPSGEMHPVITVRACPIGRRSPQQQEVEA